MAYYPIANNNIEPAAKYCMKIANIEVKPCNYVCTPKHNIGIISHARIHAYIFFWIMLLPFLFLTQFVDAYNQSHAESCVQIVNIAVKQAQIIVVHKFKMLKLD